MNVNLYLPDELGQQAKEADLPLSQLLRAAVVDELERRAAVSETLKESEVHALDLEDKDGNPYFGRLEGRLIAYDDSQWTKPVAVFLTTDERLMVHEHEKFNLWEVENDPETVLRDLLGDGPFMEAMVALGIKPTIDV